VKLWLLRPRADVLAREVHPWEPPFEKVFGLVIRAATEAAARALAQSQAGQEGLGIYRQFGLEEDEAAANVWIDSAWTSCDELEPGGEAGVVLVDRREA
jgi:hypothetical protein